MATVSRPIESSPSDRSSFPTTVGVPREIKPNETRVGLTPNAAREFVRRGHKVLVEQNAGAGSGFSDVEYSTMGCTVLGSAEEVYRAAKMIVKVKEPLPVEYELIQPGQVVFTYFHFAADETLTRAMMDRRAVCISYETIEKDNELPLLLPMSEVAGKLSVQEGAKYLESSMGGLGVLLGGVTGVKPARVLILGGGVVGTAAASVAAGMGADVVVLDVNCQRMRYLDAVMPKNVRTIFNTEQTLLTEIRAADLVIGAVLIPGKRTPRLLRRDHLPLMKKGAVIVDVAVDQGGCVQTTRPTTHEDPIYTVDGVVHYCVGNMPGAVPVTSTIALSNATLKYGLALADLGWREACRVLPELVSGLSVVFGSVYCAGVADAFDIPLSDPAELLREVS